jgi:hypothetical protein
MAQEASMERSLDKMVRSLFENCIKYSEEVGDDDRAAMLSLFGLLLNRAKTMAHHKKIGISHTMITSVEDVVQNI